MKYHALFFTTFMYINMHDGIDFDGFNNLTFEKKIFFDSHFLFLPIEYNGIKEIVGITSREKNASSS